MNALPLSARIMRSAVLIEPGRIEIREVPKPEPGPNEVRVQVEACGVCASNLEPWAGQPWFTYPMAPGALGHEACGRIDALGCEVTRWQIGQRVSMLSAHAYAQFDLAASDALVAIPPALNGQPVPGEPLGCALNIFARARICPTDTVAIVGIGFLGALLTQLAASVAARVIAIGRRPSTLALARSMGAQETIELGDRTEVKAKVDELTGGRGCEVTIEATGRSGPLELSAEITAERGRLVIAGYHQDGPRTVNMQLWNWRGLDVINAHERALERYIGGMEAALCAVADRRLNPAPLYTHLLPLEELGRALDLTRDRPEGFMKALILP